MTSERVWPLVLAILALWATPAPAQTITLRPLAANYTCTASAVSQDASEQFPDCRFDLRRMHTRQDITLTFEVGGGPQARDLRLLISPMEFGEDPSAQHVIPFPRAPVLAGIGPSIRAERRNLNQRAATGDTVSYSDAAEIWRIAIWADLGRTSAFPDADIANLVNLRDDACRMLLEKYPTLHLTQRSVRRRRLEMCSQNAQLNIQTENRLLGQLPLLDLQLANMETTALDADFLSYVQGVFGEARTIVNTRAAAGADVNQYNLDLNTLNYRFLQASQPRLQEGS